MKFIVDILVSILLAAMAAFSLHDVPRAEAQSDSTQKVLALKDSIIATNAATLRLHAITSQKLDSVVMLREYLKKVLDSHDYRTYKYTNPNVKLIYKWCKGTPGHWELIKRLYY